MIGRLFQKNGEIILSTFTAIVVAGLIYQGVSSLVQVKEHAIFQQGSAVAKRVKS